jgi:hypothetical protein
MVVKTSCLRKAKWKDNPAHDLEISLDYKTKNLPGECSEIVCLPSNQILMKKRFFIGKRLGFSHGL